MPSQREIADQTMAELERTAEFLGPDCLRTVKEARALVDASWDDLEQQMVDADHPEA